MSAASPTQPSKSPRVDASRKSLRNTPDFDSVIGQLRQFGQEHVYQDLQNFDEEHPVYKQLQGLNIERSVGHFHSANAANTVDKTLEAFAPVSTVVDLLNCDYANLASIGANAIRAGQVAAVIMSGGQGTRLGYPGPKGMYNLGMPSHKTIFQLHVEKVTKARSLFGAAADGTLPSVPIYVMTSNLNHSIIVDFFKEKNYFGYPSEDVVFFEQGVEPSYTFEGKIIIESASSLSLAPDGNGGIYRALLYSGCIEDMKRRGVEHLHIYGIDNVLTKSLDPVFLGACIEQNAECGNKVVWRAHKSEKVGVTAELDGRMHVLEYSELPPDLADAEDANGKLLFGAANICNHYLSVTFLVDTVLPSLSAVYHVAKKKIPYYDPATQETVTPSEVNGVKLEMFIFDVFPLATRWVVVEGLRRDEFAPVKNAPGSDQVYRVLGCVTAFLNRHSLVCCLHISLLTFFLRKTTLPSCRTHPTRRACCLVPRPSAGSATPARSSPAASRPATTMSTASARFQRYCPTQARVWRRTQTRT